MEIEKRGCCGNGGREERLNLQERGVLTTLHVADEILLQSVPADVGIAIVEITVPFAAVFAAELLRFSAGDGVERMSFPHSHRGRRLLSETRGGAVGLQQGMGKTSRGEGWARDKNTRATG